MIEPRWALIGAVSRKTRSGYTPSPEQRISINDALRIHTLGSAYAAFEEHIKGSIERMHASNRLHICQGRQLGSPETKGPANAHPSDGRRT